mmetsp:Transcript_79309/g.224504  ORF Transcript_79309/g.224504 Transcript_79309/m.224504 type:complete len:275 (+) Transcript_79309:84-908(+)
MLCKLGLRGFYSSRGSALQHAKCNTRGLLQAGPRHASSASSAIDYSLYLVTDDKYLSGDLAQRVRAFIDGGVSCVQVRLKKAGTADYVEATRRVLEVARPRGVPVLVDDRLDVCLAAGADGLHVGAGDLDPATARRLLGPGKLLGISTYGDQGRILAACAPEVRADYVAGGGVAASTTKTYSTKGAEHLRGVKDFLATLPHSPPLVAIGGIGRDNAFEVVLNGADGVAVVASLLDGPASGDFQRAKELRDIIDSAHATALQQQRSSAGESSSSS